MVPNAATARWCDEQGRIPAWVALAQRRVERAIQPLAMLRDASGAPHASHAVPLYTPASLQRGPASHAIETTPLYAGESVARIRTLRHACDVMRQLGGRA